MFPSDFVRELNKKVPNYCQYFTGSEKFQRKTLETILNEVQQLTTYGTDHFAECEKAQYQLRPQVSFQLLLNELHFCEQGLKDALLKLDQLTPKLR